MAPLAFISFAPDIPGALTGEQLRCVTTEGPFGLLPEGGVIVNWLVLQVPPGTPVGLAGSQWGVQSPRGGTLYWKGLVEGIIGTWQLVLINASIQEAINIQRVLLGLPPPKCEPVAPSKPRELPSLDAMRNSLVLFNEDTNQVIGAIPLPPPKDTIKPPLPTKDHHVSGKEIAARVDEFTENIFSGVDLTPGLDKCMREIEQDSSQQIATRGAQEPSRKAIGQHLNLDTDNPAAVKKAKEEHQRNLAELDALMGPLEPFPVTHPTKLTNISIASISSLATNGTGPWVTASEGGPSLPGSQFTLHQHFASATQTTIKQVDEEYINTGFSEWAELERRHSRVATILADADEEPITDHDITPTQSTVKVEERSVEQEKSKESASTEIPSIVPLSRIQNTEEAVLLRFLAGSTMTVTPIKTNEVESQNFVPMGSSEAQDPVTKSWSEYFNVTGLFSSLGGLFSWISWTKPAPAIEDPTPVAFDSVSSVAPTHYPTMSYFMPSSYPLYLSSRSRKLIGRSGFRGETANRVSVFLYDDEGRRRRAYVDGAVVG